MTDISSAPDDDAPHLLVVDDDTRIRNLLKQYLTENGFRITVAGNADEARRQLTGLDFDLLILDVMMPGLSGLDVLRKVREDERTKAVPVILLTARSRDSDVDSGFATGATDYVIKPFSPRELVHRVSSVLARGA